MDNVRVCRYPSLGCPTRVHCPQKTESVTAGADVTVYISCCCALCTKALRINFRHDRLGFYAEI